VSERRGRKTGGSTGGKDAGPQAGAPAGSGGSDGSAAPAGSGGPGGSGGSGGSAADGTGAAGSGGGQSGPELARAALEAAQARRRAAPRKPRPPIGSGRRLRGYSGPGPDPRDPQPFGLLLGRLVKNRGWQRPAAEALVFGDWTKVVGEDVASHCRPVKLEDGVLTVEAESTAWATQLRLLSGRLLATIAAQVGNNVVRTLHIHGPAAPSWSRGPRRVRGRGPRDTYG
jgi:predicted nucleic acid-binding Zn ribbon protein